jgi:hypothetical protein
MTLIAWIHTDLCRGKRGQQRLRHRVIRRSGDPAIGKANKTFNTEEKRTRRK